MKINIKDRKTLSLVLCLILVCVFTLTVAYSALSAVLTINGNARVSAANWDIYLNNPRVTSGSATTNVPEIKTSSTLEFETTLNMPGDFYEFVVDVVNGGDIDAMIENVVKTPDLTAEQAKFLKYEVSYQNGESITTKQLLAKDTTMPIKVRVEYRKDLSNTDLPTGQVVLDLSLTLEYVQSDGTGSLVTNNGMIKPVANGDINEIGTIVTIGTEQFYTIGIEGNNVKLLAMYNLHVGNSIERVWNDELEMYDYVSMPLKNPTGVQSEFAKGNNSDVFPKIGTTVFSDENHHGINYLCYEGSIAEIYVNNYKFILENEYDITVSEARLITLEEVTNSSTFACERYGKCSEKYPWLYSTSYWTGSYDDEYASWVFEYSEFTNEWCPSDCGKGVRPVIVISKDYFI